jgi:imidazolonepropionase
MNLFIKNISQLVTVAAHGKRFKVGAEMRDLGILHNAGVLCQEGKIAWVGSMQDWDRILPNDFPELDGSGMVVLPGFVDSHTHLVFAGNRVHEFGRRSEGATYQEIAAEGGGILSTVSHVRAATKKEMKRQASVYLTDMLRHGTTTVEIKSGYGLQMDAEIRMLEAIHELQSEEMISIVPTFLGAHAIPPEFRSNRSGYLDLVLHEMIPYVGRKKLASFCDVFCDAGYFEPAEAERILSEGKRWGMVPKIHADELTPSGGVEVAAKVGAVSADHLEHVTDAGIAALRESGVIATLLPGVSFFLNHRFAPARRLIDAGVPVAIATDFNPGSCMSFSIPMMMTIACTQMSVSPEEAISATTLNGAAAAGVSTTHGSIEVGKSADLLLVNIPDYRYLAYHFGTNHVWRTIKNGTLLEP